MVTHRGFSAWICSAGQKLREYGVSVDANTNRAFCWIPCEIGEHFSVHWEDLGSGIDSAGFIVLDGSVVPGQFLYGSGAAQRSGVRISAASERPFVFSHVRCDPHETNKELGTITVKIKQIRRTHLDHKPNTPLALLPSPRGMSSSGVSISVGYGQIQATEEQFPATWSCEPYDPQQPGTFVTFCFRYRPKDFLISQGIMLVDEQSLPFSAGKGSFVFHQMCDKSTTYHTSLPSLNLHTSVGRQSSYNYGSVSTASIPSSSTNSLLDVRDHPYAVSRPPSRNGLRKVSRGSSTSIVPHTAAHFGEQFQAASAPVITMKGRSIAGGKRSMH